MASSSSFHRGSDEIFLQDCDVCKYHQKTSEAISYCTSCGEYLCVACENVHRGSKLTRNHTLLTGSSMYSKSTTSISTSPIMFCEDHKTMIVYMYCLKHDDIICDTCKLISHRRCNTTDINQQAKQMKNDGSFQEPRKRLEDLKSQYDKMKVMRNTDKGIVKSKIDKCLQDMRKLRKNINEALDHIEDTLSKKIHQINESSNKDIENHIAILDDALTQISDHVNSLNENEEARDDVMYVGMKKASNVTSRYKDILLKMEDEVNETKTTFQLNGKLSDMLKQLQSIDTFLIDSSRVSLQMNQTDGQGTSGRLTQKSPTNLKVSSKRSIDVGYKGVYGCTFMPDGHLVLCCGDDGLVLLDADFKVKSRLDVKTYRVAVINDTEVITANYGEKQIKTVKLFPSMEVTKTMSMDMDCYGVDMSGDEIYVTCYYRIGNGEVQVLNMNGTLQRRLGVNNDNGKYIFKLPDYVTVSKDGSRVFVSDSHSDNVTCLDKQGHVTYKYSDTKLNYPAGMYVDYEGNLLVCGYYSNNVHVIQQDGRKEKILLSETDGIKRPVCTAFRQSDGCLVVGMAADTTQSLICFTAK